MEKNRFHEVREDSLTEGIGKVNSHSGPSEKNGENHKESNRAKFYNRGIDVR